MSTNDGCRADKRKARTERDAPTVEAVALRVLAEHGFMPCGEFSPTVRVWWAQCFGCDWKGPRRPNRDEHESDHRAHVAASLAAAIEARP